MVNTTLMAAGLIDQPLDWLLFSDFAVYLSLITAYMPFMIFPLYLSLATIDRRYLEASWLLGEAPTASSVAGSSRSAAGELICRASPRIASASPSEPCAHLLGSRPPGQTEAAIDGFDLQDVAATKEAGDETGPWVAKQPLRRIELDQLALVQNDDAIVDSSRFLLVMGDVEKGRTGGLLDRSQFRLHLPPDLLVEGGQRLVEQ